MSTARTGAPRISRPWGTTTAASCVFRTPRATWKSMSRMSASEGGNLGERTEEELAAEDGRRPLHCYGWGGSTSWVQGTHRRFTPRERMQRRFRGRRSRSGTTQQDYEKVALRRWTSDERINGYENEPSVWTRPTVEALLPYNRRRREGGATARAGARARGGKEEKRPSRTALKQARAVKTGQVQLQRRAPRLPREHGGGSAVRYANPRGLHRQVRSRI